MIMDRPEIVCLCGSTRFMDAFFEAGWKFTLEGKIVLSVGVCKHAKHHGAEALGQDVADRLDELHLRKIDLADSVFVLNVGGYIGESTRKEIEYAESKNKPIGYLESCGAAEDDEDQALQNQRKSSPAQHRSGAGLDKKIMKEPSIEYDQGFIDGEKEGRRQLQAENKQLREAVQGAQRCLCIPLGQETGQRKSSPETGAGKGGQ